MKILIKWNQWKDSVPPAPVYSGDNDIADIIEFFGGVSGNAEENSNGIEGIEDDDAASVSSSVLTSAPSSPAAQSAEAPSTSYSFWRRWMKTKMAMKI